MDSDDHDPLSPSEISDKKLLRFVTDHCPVCIANCDKGLRYKFVNKPYADMFGLSVADVLGRHVSEILGDEAYAHARPHMELALSGESNEYDLDLPTETGLARVVHVSYEPEYDNSGRVIGFVAAISDITKRKQIEEQLQDKMHMLERVLDTEPGTVYIYDLIEQKNIYINQYWLAAYGYTPEETQKMGIEILSLFHPDDLSRIVANHEAQKDADDGSVHVIEYRIRDKNGEWHWLISRETPYERDEDGRVCQILGIASDITDRKQAETAMNKSEELYRTLFSNMLNGFAYCQMVFDESNRPQDFIYLEVNASFEQLTGLKDVVGKRVSELIPGVQESDSSLFEVCGRVSRSGKPERFEIYLDALQQWFWISAYRHEQGYFMAIFDVITDRKKAELKLIESENRYRKLFENMNTGFVLFEVVQDDLGSPLDLKILAANDMFEQTTGLITEQVIGKRLTHVLPGIEKDEADWIGTYGKVALTGEAIEFENDSKLLGLSYFVSAYQVEPNQCAVTFLDITERNKTQDALTKSEERFALAMQAANDGVWDWNMETNDVVFSTRWKSMLGYAENELENRYETWERLVHPKDIERAKRTISAYLEGKRSKYEVEFRMRHKDGHWVDILARGNAVRSQESGNYIRFVGTHVDLSMQKQAEVAIRSALLGTISAVSKIVEARDPYTGGHEDRVSHLSRAIALEMGLNSDQIEGVTIGAAIHDIGKVQVPAEILSKPGQLSDAEYMVVQAHAETGHNILKGIEFPWPVANVAHQHHERLDGSGYPQGLRGDEICLEARVVAVADVVEAMASHRPYRPALGIEVALEEIKAHRGTKYDENVVDACLTVIIDQDFSFE